VYDGCCLHFGEIGCEPLPVSVWLDTKYAYLTRILSGRYQADEILALTKQERIDLLNGPEEEFARKVTGSKLALGTRTLLVCM
jgi:hypothetical protein